MPRPALPIVLIALLLAGPAAAGEGVADAPYPGTIRLAVDATDLNRRIVRVREEIPVRAGELILQYPQWLPGQHAPYGPIAQLAGLQARGNGQRIAWRRDPLDVYSFRLQVPDGVDTLQLEYQFLSPTAREQGRVVVTPEILGLQWNTLLLYPAGYRADGITFQVQLTLPAGWQFGSALEVEAKEGAQLRFRPTSLGTLVDSPLFAGKHFRQFDLDPGAQVPVRLNAVADTAQALEAKPALIEQHRALVRQADRLFGARHFTHYDFLLALSERFSGIGLEHHQSSENGVGTGYFTDDKGSDRDLLAHEYAHSWNGKFRRGADLLTPNFNVPMQTSLLWVYEGQTQYWGYVLAARAGLMSAEQVREAIANVAAGYAHREGRAWRDLADTTAQPVISRRGPLGWRSWQRGEDYYSEGQLLWLAADALIRERSGGRRSLDDFARAFFGVGNGRVTPLPYAFDDVAKVLDGVLGHDWTAWLRERVEGLGGEPLLDGLARSGWRLVYTDQPGKDGGDRAAGSFTYSLGLGVGKDMQVGDVLWNGPAFQAGLASGQRLVAVNGEVATLERLKQAVIGAQKDGTPIELLVDNLERIGAVRIDYRGGLRYPHLERVPGTPDRLGQILAPRK